MGCNNVWLLVEREKKGTARYNLNIQNVTKGTGGQQTAVA